ncbi:MAG: M64 family metallo-endopeptidase [Bacteroidales bacterium]|nr:M64 family metallo-endopeptidase [Bacteroidales bacterium]
MIKKAMTPLKKTLRLLFYLGMAIVAFVSCSKDAPPEIDSDNGTPDSPYIIFTPEQLDAVRNNPSAHYILGRNIDLTDYLRPDGSGWNPIESFTGSFDGAGYKITGLWINRSSSNGVGLVAEHRGQVKNLGVEIADAGIIGANHVGGVAGVVLNSSGAITNCYVTGNVSGALYVGGVAGSVNGGSITNCYATGAVSGSEYTGGVTGVIFNNGSVANCYATGAVNGNRYVGGVAGAVGHLGSSGNMANCVALNLNIISNGEVGRVAGGISGGSLANNWARIMPIGRSDVSITINLDKGKERMDGEDIAPTGSEGMEAWWQASMWAFGSSDDNPWKWGTALPIFYWQTAPPIAITKVTGIAINASDVSLEMGKTTAFTATVTPVHATYQNVIWSSSNTGIATVNTQTGVVTGISAGTATISVAATGGSRITAYKSVTITHAEIGFGDGDWYAAQTSTIGLGVDLVFMGDGYTAEDIATGKYERDMHKAIEYFFDIQPYKAYRNYFNAYIVGAVSAESGIGTSGVPKDTRFSTYHDEYAARTSRMHTDRDVCLSFAHKAPIKDIDQTVVILVANSAKHGGTCVMWPSGRAIATCPINAPTAKSTLQHEAGGHGFAKLADEYIDAAVARTHHPNDIPRYHPFGWYLNVDVTMNPLEVIWRDFIGHPKYPMVGVFPGGYYFSSGVYRPEQRSLMGDPGISPLFNAPSRAAIVKRIQELAGEAFDMERFMATDIIEPNIPTRVSLELLSMPPLPPPVLILD